MNLAAARAIASVVSDDELHPDYIIPSPFNRRVVESVARAVTEAARESGVARRAPDSAAAAPTGSLPTGR